MATTTILDAAPFAMALLKQPAFVCEFANRAFRDLVGASIDPAGRPFESVHPALAALLRPALEEVARSGEPQDAEDVPLPPAGDARQRWARFRIRRLPPDGTGAVGVLIAAEDATERVVARAREQALGAIAAELGSERASLAETLERVAGMARGPLGADASFVLVAGGEPARFDGTIEVGSHERLAVTARGEELPGGSLSMSRGEPVAIRAEAAEGVEATWLRASGQATALCAPLQAGGRPLGLLYFGWSDGTAPRDAEIRLVRAVASMCSVDARRERMLQREQEARLASRRATERLELLSESGALLTAAVDWATVVRTTAQLGLGYLADAAVLDLVGTDGVLRREAFERAVEPSGESPFPIVGVSREVESPTIRDVLFTRRSRLIVMPKDGWAGSGDLRVLEAIGATSCIVAPLVIRGRAAGALTLVRRTPSPPHEPEDVDVATEIARRAAIALDDARLLAAAADESAARDAFLAAAAHDIRSPLTALGLQLESLERGVTQGDRVKARVARLRASLARLTRRVEDVLEAARATARAAPLRRESLDLAELARDVVRRVARERVRTAFPVQVVAPDPVLGWWDRRHVDGIITNLLSVAAKRGGREVEVRVTPEERGGRIEVRRPGADDDRAAPHGLSAAKHEELEVGVWIARRLAEAHGGRLRVVPLPHVGARFTVDIPG